VVETDHPAPVKAPIPTGMSMKDPPETILAKEM
jgi:hypothetical protein